MHRPTDTELRRAVKELRERHNSFNAPALTAAVIQAAYDWADADALRADRDGLEELTESAEVKRLRVALRYLDAAVGDPYWGQRDYGFAEQIGMEPTWPEYVATLVDVFGRLRDGLTDDGTLWLNLGDTFNTRAVIRGSSHQGGLGHDNENIRLSWSEAVALGKVRYSARQPGLKDKDLMGLPFRVVQALVADGWFLRCDVIWSKPYGSPENAADRPTRMHEYLFLLSKSSRYHYDKTACPEAHRSVWEIAPANGTGEHAAIFPDELVRRCLLLTSRPADVVADPFAGSGTVARVAGQMHRVAIGIDGREWAETRTPSRSGDTGSGT